MLDDPESFKTKEESKKSVLDYIFQPQLYPDLYEDLYHVVRINYYPPRGDNKEGWDNIDLVGWLGYPMQLKINFLCRDSILAAPIVLDVGAVPRSGEARRACRGIQEWLSFYFKSPMHAPGLYPEHDLFIQLMKLKNTLRYLQGRRADHAPRPWSITTDGLSAACSRRSSAGRSSACCRRCRSSTPATAAAACGWSAAACSRPICCSRISRRRSPPATARSSGCSPASSARVV